ncbi:MAG: hypothetical protein PHD37_17190 [Gallionellaceae bacterium]|nr:hypothetical protein [Gallionellaceae bacterium]
MPARDTYELLLELRDELSGSLRRVNASLGQTRSAGQQAASGIKGVATSMKTATAQFRAFSQIMRQITTLGGAAYAIHTVVRTLGELEAAYLKLHPEMNKVIGSSAQFTAAVNANKVALGQLVNEIVSPARAEVQAVLQEWADQVKGVNDEFDRTGEIVGTVVQYIIKAVKTTASLALDTWKFWIGLIDAIVKIVAAVGKIIWLPLKVGFEWVVYGIKVAFQETINFLAGMVEGLVQSIGKALSWISGGKLGKDLLGFDIKAMNAGAAKPAEVNIAAEWKKILEPLSKDLGSKFEGFGQAIDDLVKIWSTTPEATLIATPPDLEAIKKLIEERKKEAREIADAGERERTELYAGLVAYYENQRKFDEDLLKAQAEQLRLAREERRARMLSAQSFMADPMAEIGKVIQTALEGASMVDGGIMEMIPAFFDLLVGGFQGLLDSLVEFGPLIALAMVVIQVLSGIAEILGPIVINMLAPFLAYLEGWGNVLGTLLLPILEAFEPALNAIGMLLNGLLPLFELLVPVFQAIGWVIKAVLVPVVGIVRVVIMAINLFIDGLNWAFGWLGVKLKRLTVPDMPTFHSGGVAEDDTMALLKKGEVVLNPYKSKSYVAGGGGGGITINAPNARYIDKTLAADLVRMGLAGMRA